jgi:CBS domain-containing protein
LSLGGQELYEHKSYDVAAMSVSTLRFADIRITAVVGQRLSQATAVMIEPDGSVEGASARMLRNGVRLVFMTDAQHRLPGFVTATDILGEKAVQAMLARWRP